MPGGKYTVSMESEKTAEDVPKLSMYDPLGLYSVTYGTIEVVVLSMIELTFIVNPGYLEFGLNDTLEI